MIDAVILARRIAKDLGSAFRILMKKTGPLRARLAAGQLVAICDLPKFGT